jgi:lipoprotein-releasing system permease protein
MQSIFNIFISALIPRSRRFEFQVAMRHLLSGGWQTLMTISAVTTGVIIVIFITCLIFGLQDRISTLLTNAIPHITIRVAIPTPKTLADLDDKSLTSSKIEQQAPQLKLIDNWEQIVSTVSKLPNVKAVAPIVTGQGFASKGANPKGVSVIGADPVLQDSVTPVTPDLIAGKYQRLGSDEIVIDYQLAKDLNVSVGEQIRLNSSVGISESLNVAGIYSSGQGRGSAYITLRNGQSFFGYGSSVNSIYVKVYDIYDVDNLANTIMALVPYEARPWTADFGSFLTNMNVMGASAYLISAFSLIASAFSIAAVLIVSVLQKSQQIGILKSMGAKQSQILRIFVFEGLGVAIFGSFLGAFIGTLVVYFLGLLTRASTQIGKPPDQLFPVKILPTYIALAVVAAIITTVIASVLPARRAAKLNPVDVMR